MSCNEDFFPFGYTLNRKASERVTIEKEIKRNMVVGEQIKVVVLVPEKIVMAQRTSLDDKAGSQTVVCHRVPCRLEMIRRISRDTRVVTALLARHCETSRPPPRYPIGRSQRAWSETTTALFFFPRLQTTRREKEQTQKQEACRWEDSRVLISRSSLSGHEFDPCDIWRHQISNLVQRHFVWLQD